MRRLWVALPGARAGLRPTLRCGADLSTRPAPPLEKAEAPHRSPDYHENPIRAQQAWRVRHPGYWRAYRVTHAGYTKANRAQ